MCSVYFYIAFSFVVIVFVLVLLMVHLIVTTLKSGFRLAYMYVEPIV